MKSFIKQLSASCLGTLLALGLLVLVLSLVAVSITKKEKAPGSGILHIPLEGTISEYGQVSLDWDNLNFSGSPINLWELRNKIYSATDDKNVEAIYLEIKTANLSQTIALELIQILNQFKDSGKKVYAYSQYYEQNPYMVASVADSVFINPNGGIDLKGYAIFAPFFKNVMDRWNINLNIYYAGKYKGSTEPYRLTEFSDENEYQLRKYLNNMHDHLIMRIAKGRKLMPEKVENILRNHRSYDVDYSLENELVDGILYEDEMIEFLKTRFKHGDLIPVSAYAPKMQKKEKTDVAIVFAEGEIVWGKGRSGSIGNDTYKEIFKKIRADKKIKKVLIRFNSPGGNGVASDNLNREIKLLKKEGKKVYASFGEMAASGAYYMAAACDSIFSQSNSLTGSIGVYIMLPDFNDFLEEEIGITFDSISSSPKAITYSPILNISEEEEKQLQIHTEKLYRQFLTRVSEGRGISIDSVDVLAQGRLWTGLDAEKKGLVDGIFSFEDALRIVTGENDIAKKSFAVFPENKLTLTEQLVRESLGEVRYLKNLEKLSQSVHAIDFQLLNDYTEPKMQLPFTINVIKQ